MHETKYFISQEEPSVHPTTSLLRVAYLWDLVVLNIGAAAWLIIY